MDVRVKTWKKTRGIVLVMKKRDKSALFGSAPVQLVNMVCSALASVDDGYKRLDFPQNKP